jgi:hypothetical protein
MEMKLTALEPMSSSEERTHAIHAHRGRAHLGEQHGHLA